MKRYAFYGTCTLVAFALAVAALVMNPRHNVGLTQASSIMLLLAGAVIGLMLIVLLVSAVIKRIQIRMKKIPVEIVKGRTADDAMSLRILTTGGKYDEKYDDAERDREKRIAEQMKE